ncbi:LruC domain-containing protein [Leptospira stimsonii]|uniref:LruC domain-containing protein n=1 Tax=Leptospira stimsonii TaxID=2202203 RepID=A0ABY2N421_9LEPT|nr:LruC domain-containing protein [Leptospira stimsonii]TGK22961.1 LruC domain-containing protein [Leptospira stimsonii]TGM16605.1 LruC domain-containing protein [Leptospira stimsonii]
MRGNSKIASLILTGFLLLGLNACTNSQDPNLLWLLSATQPNPSPAPDGEQPFSIVINDETAPVDFVFDTTKTVNVNIQVLSPDSPISGSLVQIFNIDNTAQKSVFRAVTAENGEVKGSFTIDEATRKVTLKVEAFGQLYEAEIEIINSFSISRKITVIIKGNNVLLPDTDGDGIVDRDDTYPNDPTRASTFRYPANGYYTISYEDLFPNQGDADFNDYNVRVVFEEDWNAKGEVARVRAKYTHVAKGAGYNHTLHLTIPGATVSSYSLTRYAYDGTTVENTFAGNNTPIQALEILPRSNTTIPSSNTSRSNTTFKIGKSAALEVVLQSAINRVALGAAPYDTFLKVINTNQEIHFPRRYFDSNGKDVYLDSTGFPWALLVPGNFLWPYESTDIRKSYPSFKPWYESMGNLNADWYLSPVLSEVFPPSN